MKELLSGNIALCKGAMWAGIDAYFGYPITPQNEIPEFFSYEMPKLNKIFVQSESEIAAASMVMGAATTGKKVMTTSSSPGISLMQETLSYMCGCELPAVFANIARCGPGLGGIAPSQADYFQSVHSGGHGDYKLTVLAPASAQETFDLTAMAFYLAFKYRNPVMILTDGLLGQMLEPVENIAPSDKIFSTNPFDTSSWTLSGAKDRKPRHIKSLFLNPIQLEAHNLKLQAKYKKIAEEEVRYEEYQTDDADYLIVAYGSSSRISKGAIEQLRKKGKKIGMLRPITLSPFPSGWLINNASRFKNIVVMELSAGQMLVDVKCAVEGRTTVSFYGRMGGAVFTTEELVAEITKICNL